MGARTFGNNDPSCLTPGQLQALAAIGIDESDFVNTGCKSPALNSCGRDFLGSGLIDQSFILTQDSLFYLVTEDGFPLIIEYGFDILSQALILTEDSLYYLISEDGSPLNL